MQKWNDLLITSDARWFEIGDGLKFKLFSIHSTAFKKRQRQLGFEYSDDEEDRYAMAARGALCLVQTWEGMFDEVTSEDGESELVEVPYSEEEAKKRILDPDAAPVVEWITNTAVTDEAFRKKPIEEVVKN